MSEDAILSFNSTHKNLSLCYSKWREVSLPCHKPMGCNHPYFLGCTLHIFNHVLLLTDDYSLQRLSVSIPSAETLAECLSTCTHMWAHTGKYKQAWKHTCGGGGEKGKKDAHIMCMLSGDKLPSCCLHGTSQRSRAHCWQHLKSYTHPLTYCAAKVIWIRSVTCWQCMTRLRSLSRCLGQLLREATVSQ